MFLHAPGLIAVGVLLGLLFAALCVIAEQKGSIMAALDDLKTQVSRTGANVVTANGQLTDLASKLDAAIAAGDPVAIAQATADLDAANGSLEAALAATKR